VKLVDLDPRWYSAQGNHARHGITFDCPCCLGTDRASRLAIATHVDGTNFDTEPDRPQTFRAGETVWTITSGSDFSDLSISPSVDASKHGHWHGFITQGEIR
jgi:hypothetical protein